MQSEIQAALKLYNNAEEFLISEVTWGIVSIAREDCIIIQSNTAKEYINLYIYPLYVAWLELSVITVSPPRFFL